MKIQEYCIIIAYSHEHSNMHTLVSKLRPFLSTRRFISKIPSTKIIGRRDEYRRGFSSKCKLKIFHHKFLQFSLNMNKCMKRSPSRLISLNKSRVYELFELLFFYILHSAELIAGVK